MTCEFSSDVIQLKEPIPLVYGGELSGVQVNYETWGRLNPTRSNAILLMPAFSAGSHARSHEADPDPGWWESLIGPGLALDTDTFQIICPSLLGSCFGTTSPESVNPATGTPYAGSFPPIAIKDMVSVHGALLDHLQIDTAAAVIGGSLGGMQSIQFAVQFPSRTRKVVSISATAQTLPYTAAVRHLGRTAITSDPDWKKGQYGSQPPLSGLRRARELGTLFYRSREEFNERFERKPEGTPRVDGLAFDVQRYLNHQGKKVTTHFDANAYLTLSLAMDLHDISLGFENMSAAASSIQSEVLIAGVTEDRLIPIDEQRDLFDSLKDAGVSCQWRELSSPVGHDAFLANFNLMTELLSPFIQTA